jgi:hypothetical protein
VVLSDDDQPRRLRCPLQQDDWRSLFEHGAHAHRGRDVELIDQVVQESLAGLPKAAEGVSRQGGAHRRERIRMHQHEVQATLLRLLNGVMGGHPRLW